MGIMGWIYYAVFGMFLFLLLFIFQYRFSITKLEQFVLSLLYLVLVAAFFQSFSLPYTDNVFLLFVFLFITDFLYQHYFLENDFFNRSDKNIEYYLFLILLGFVLNQSFINRVDHVFLSGKDFRFIFWAFVILFFYSFCNRRDYFSRSTVFSHKEMSKEAILVRYAKFKYQFYDECNCENRDVSNLLYAIMIFNDSRRSKFLRKFDYFLFRIHGNKRKLGIMQVETNHFISDSESIAFTYDKIIKIIEKKSKTRKKLSMEDVIQEYSSQNKDAICFIFDVIKKF